MLWSWCSRMLMVVYNNDGYGNMATLGFGWPKENETDASFWHTASKGWADPRVGLFLSRHREAPKDEVGENLYYEDSEIMTG